MRFEAAGATRLLVKCFAGAAVSAAIVGCSSPAGESMTTPPSTLASTTPSVSHSATQPSSIVMPNLVGRYWLDALPELTDMGWRGVLIKGPDIAAAPEDINRVLSQDPAAGSALSPDTAITLQFGS